MRLLKILPLLFVLSACGPKAPVINLGVLNVDVPDISWSDGVKTWHTPLGFCSSEEAGGQCVVLTLKHAQAEFDYVKNLEKRCGQ
jgi:hypothetical protein